MLSCDVGSDGDTLKVLWDVRVVPVTAPSLEMENELEGCIFEIKRISGSENILETIISFILSL